VRSVLHQVQLADPPLGILGEISSSITKPMATLAGVFGVPVVSGSSSSVDLSAKHLYPLFAR
jgi:hypothetical protein